MNIFLLDNCHRTNVMYYSDQHVVKMILETAQLLCSVHYMTDSNIDIPYKLTHANHPCAKWARHSLNNYEYLVRLGQELCAEYSIRFNKTHKSSAVINWAYENSPNLRYTGLSPLPLVMPEQYFREAAVDAYRTYYQYKYITSMHDKRRRMKWTHRPIPDFILEVMREVVEYEQR